MYCVKYFQALIQQLIDILMNGVSERSYAMQLTSPVSPFKSSFSGSSFQSSTNFLDRGYVNTNILHSQ